MTDDTDAPPPSPPPSGIQGLFGEKPPAPVPLDPPAEAPKYPKGVQVLCGDGCTDPSHGHMPGAPRFAATPVGEAAPAASAPSAVDSAATPAATAAPVSDAAPAASTPPAADSAAPPAATAAPAATVPPAAISGTASSPPAAAASPPPPAAAGSAPTASQRSVAYLSNWLANARLHHQQNEAAGLSGYKDQMAHMLEHLHEAAEKKTPGAQELYHMAVGLGEHITHEQEKHGSDPKRMQALSDLLARVETTVAQHANSEKPHEAIHTALRPLLVEHKIAIPKTTLRDPSLPLRKELAAQVSDHWGAKKFFGKGMAILGATTSVGIIGLGAVDVKRGIAGYHDPETGEKREGAFSNIVVGLAKMSFGLMGLTRALTGRWIPGRATHPMPHHDHDHHHDHHHGHSH